MISNIIFHTVSTILELLMLAFVAAVIMTYAGVFGAF